MNEIRFNQPAKYPTKNIFQPEDTLPEVKTSLKKSWLKHAVVFLIILGVAFLGFWLLQGKIRIGNQASVLSGFSDDRYNAVFLLNGQVYFGKMVSNNEKEMILKDVYYLQASSASTTEGKKYDLIKLGTEVHGPTSEIFITKSNVLFYENLREDSEVLKSIKNRN